MSMKAMAVAPRDGTMILVVAMDLSMLWVMFWGEYGKEPYRDATGVGWIAADDGEVWSDKPDGGSLIAGWYECPPDLAANMPFRPGMIAELGADS